MKKVVLFFAMLLLTGFVFAADNSTALVPINSATTGAGGLGGVFKSIVGSFTDLARLMLAIAYVAGIGFLVAAFFKAKQHKDNPQQIPLGTPIALFVIAISLIFLAYFVKPAGETIGATEEQAGGPTGSVKLPGMK